MILNITNDVIELNILALKQRSTAAGQVLCQAHLISMSFCPCSWFTVRLMASVTRTHRLAKGSQKLQLHTWETTTFGLLQDLSACCR